MPTYIYRCLTTGDEFEFEQNFSDSALTEHFSEETGKVEPCERLICAPALMFGKDGSDLDFQTNHKDRGYRGKFRKQLRPVGTAVDAPASKAEADRQFQRFVDSGGMSGIKPTFDLNKKDDPRRPKTSDERLQK